MNTIETSANGSRNVKRITKFINSITHDLKKKAGRDMKGTGIFITLLGIVLADAANGKREFKDLDKTARARLALQVIEKTIDILNQRLGFAVDNIFSKAFGLSTADIHASLAKSSET